MFLARSLNLIKKLLKNRALWVFGFFLIFSSFCCLSETTFKSRNAYSVQDQIHARALDNGLVAIYQEKVQIGTMAPEIFTEDWKFHAFEATGNTLKAHFEAKLPDDLRVSLDTYIEKLSRSAFRIRYTLTPQQLVRVIQVRANIFFPYDDWIGVPYQLGLIQGLIPQAPVSSYIIDSSYDSPLELGPANNLNGLTLRFISKELHVGLQDSRVDGGNLYVVFTHAESPFKAWNWKAGEKKVFDIVLELNPKTNLLSEELGSLEPKMPFPKVNTLTSSQLATGEGQLERMLRDRPAMSPYVRKGDDLWMWMVRQFAGEYVEGGIWWDARNPKPLWNAESTQAEGEKASIQITNNFYNNKYNHWNEPKTGPVLWFEAFFEIYNLRNFTPATELNKMASLGKINKEDYIMRLFLMENQNRKSVHNFFHEVWIPHCQKLHLPHEDKYLIELYGKGIKLLSAEEVYKKYFHPDRFRYKAYADEYDRLASRNVNKQ
jgi:hypothetical protein